MRKSILLASLVLGCIASAQSSNEELKKQLKERRNNINAEYDFYAQQKLSQILAKGKNTTPAEQDSIQTYLEQKKSKVSFFFEGKPYYLKLKDTHQISNANVDYIQEGNITGLNGSFNGQGIKVAVFDGGRAYEKHDDFGGVNSTRVSNKERSSVFYSDHATAVTGMIGGIGHDLTSRGVVVGNTKGMMPLATFDNYSFETTILDGETEEKDFLQKLLGALPYLSNHSYGYNNGWEYQYASTNNAGEGWYWNGNYDRNTKEYISLEGTYFEDDQYYDNIVYNNPKVIIAKAAGNEFGDGPKDGDTKYYSRSRGRFRTFVEGTDNIPPANCSQGYDCISTGSLAKNIIVVGATEKITTNNGKYSQASDVARASYSNAGPRDDGGIKPDIAGVGSNIYSASSNELGSNDWEQGSGTSYSTPQITGIIGLWTEINRTLFVQDFNASSAKTLLIHTAKEAGNIGPDIEFGWGFADAKAGAELLVDKSNNKVIFEDKSLQNNTTDEILVETDGKQPLKVSISWIDPSFKNLPETYETANNNRTSVLVNDLDLRITNVNTGEVFFPWKLDINNPLAPAIKGDNLVDNVEQILIDNPTAGTYKIEVSHKGTLVDNDGKATSKQDYSIIATGYTKIASPDEPITDTPITDNFYIYPVLLTNTSVVDIKSEHQITDIAVYDMSGRLILNFNPNNNAHSVDFNNLVNGAYIINVKLGNASTKQVKILKRKP